MPAVGAYESFSIPPAQRFDVTLHLCVLQLLLANSVELVIATNNPTKKKQWLAPLEPFVIRLLAEPGALEQNSFPDGPPDTLDVLTHLRNALSHPRMTHRVPPTTGYTTGSDPRGVITHVTFTNSPDYNTKGSFKAQEDRKHKGQPYLGPARIFTIRVAVHQLFDLTRALADRLREPATSKINHQVLPLDCAQVLAS